MKKILAILGMAACMIGLTACGSSQTGNSLPQGFDEAQWVSAGEQTVEYMQQITNQDAMEQYASDSVFYNGLTAYSSAMKDIGSYLGTDGGTVEVNSDGITININVLGSEHNAVVEIVLDDSFTPSGIATNVDYSLGEIMEKAALNTLLGMGTVFVVLVLISLIISAFGLIPKLQASLTKKPADIEVPEQKAETVVPQTVEKEELSDDLELVAVISAAIVAYEGSGHTDGFVVRSIRKANKSNWRSA